MKKFLLRIGVFALPVIAVFIGLEFYFRTAPNAFSGKAHFFRRHLHEIECLVLGSSHNQNAINPEFMAMKTANIAYAGQDEKLDSTLLFHFINQMPQLKTVIIELDYHSLEESLGRDYFRYSWYYHFYEVDNGYVPLLHKISLYASEPQFFNDILKETFSPTTTDYTYNEFGFTTNDFPGAFADVKYDSISLSTSADERLIMRHRTDSAALAQSTMLTVRTMVQLCLQKGVRPVLLASPMYTDYVQREIPEKAERRRIFIRQLTADPRVVFLDYEKDPRFKATDFKNDDHLNPDGARTFTRLLNDTLILLPGL
jgi:hypothetical protein